MNEARVEDIGEKPLENGVKGDGIGGSATTGDAWKKSRDDGWIELEEESAAQVHTGGRTIVELKR